MTTYVQEGDEKRQTAAMTASNLRACYQHVSPNTYVSRSQISRKKKVTAAASTAAI